MTNNWPLLVANEALALAEYLMFFRKKENVDLHEFLSPFHWLNTSGICPATGEALESETKFACI